VLFHLSNQQITKKSGSIQKKETHHPHGKVGLKPEDDYAVEQISRNPAGIADHPEQEYKTWQRLDNNPEYILVCILYFKNFVPYLYVI